MSVLQPLVFLSVLTALASPSVAQVDRWVRDLEAKNAVTREVARRHLALAETLPVKPLVALLAAERTEVVLAAATLLRDRKLGVAALRRISLHEDPAIRRAILPVATEATVEKLLTEGEAETRARALYELADRQRLSDAVLVRALRGDVEELADAACRLVVFERAPFPIAIADKLVDAPRARLRLITFLADRPRAAAGSWLERLLATDTLSPMERILAINALPADHIDGKLARDVLRAAADPDLAISNRAGYAATRFEPRIADGLVPEVENKIAVGVPAAALLPCLERISAAGEDVLLEYALAAAPAVRADLFQWLSSRESKRVDKYIGKALDSEKPFPPELIRLSSAASTSPARVNRIAAFLGGPKPTSIDAFRALLEAEVYHPAMLAFALAEDERGEGRRLWQLLKLPRARLPETVFANTLDTGNLVACTYAINSLARAPLSESLEPKIIAFAENAPNAQSAQRTQLQLAAARALILGGSEVGGRKAWLAMRRGEHAALAIRWLMEKPKPWSYEILLRERERLEAQQAKANPKAMAMAKGNGQGERATYHRVLIALAKLGDRGANTELVREIPRLAPDVLRQVQKLMGRFLKKADLEKLARKYLKVREGDPDEGLARDDDLNEGARVELLEWFLEHKQLDLVPTLEQLWQKDGSFEVRLVALRGLLAQDSEEFHGRLYDLLAKPYGADQKDLAFEIVGSGLGEPITEKGLELLAYIVLRAPLTDPRQEIGASLDCSRGNARGAYPILMPAVNLLRREVTVHPQAAFAKVAAAITTRRFALNRQRLGRFLAGISRREALVDELGPVIAALLLEAPDLATDYVGPAQVVLADAAEAAGAYGEAAKRYTLASKAWSRGFLPVHIQREFLGVADPVVRYHPLAALAARAPICRARRDLAAGHTDAAKRELLRARDLAEGDIDTIKEIAILRKATDR